MAAGILVMIVVDLDLVIYSSYSWRVKQTRRVTKLAQIQVQD